MGRRWPACALLLLLAMSGCNEEAVREFLGHYTPHERYERALLDAGLDRTALGRDWLAAGDAALDRAISVLPPYHEEAYLDPREVSATAYRLSLRRGQRLEVTFESEPDSSYRVFIELFRVSTRPDAPPRYLASVDSLERTLDHLARLDGDYLIRVQPELLRGGRYSVRIVVTPSLHFPVSGRDVTAIGSWYGDGRDGGRRQHEGLDIFAPRGTPVLAAADGVVRSTRNNRLGGNVVWLRDTLGHTHYYAHLDTQLVRRGQRVSVGDTLGLVGNSGNARSTPPHLHFGLYSRGSFDPFPALQPLPTAPPTFSGDPKQIDRPVRVARRTARLRAHPTASAEILAELPPHTPLQVEAGAGEWYRVSAPDGTVGFVAIGLVEALGRPLRRAVLVRETPVLSQPRAPAVTVDVIAPGDEVPVLGSFGEFLYVQGPSGRTGWLALD